MPSGKHLGTIIGFDALNAERQARADSLISDFESAGASISRIQVDWAELEPTEGQFDSVALTEALQTAVPENTPIFVTLSTLDSDGLTLPSYLLGSDGTLGPGQTIASAQVIDAFENLLDWLVPQLDAAGVFALSLGNEVDIPIEDGLATADDAVVFFQSGIEAAERIDPDLATTVTLTIGAIQNQRSFLADIVEAVDFTTFNHYCLDEALLVTRQPRWVQDFDAIAEASDSKPYFIQELGCPVGFGDDGPGAPARPPNGLMGDPSIQADYFRYTLGRLETDPQFIGATLFQLFDWSPELAASFSDPLRQAGATIAGDRLEEWLATVGLCRWSDGSCRPAWDVVLENTTALEATRN
ncbi:MAG: hypothetical protein AAGJ32_02070 [Pseudomonadota bacterium]